MFEEKIEIYLDQEAELIYQPTWCSVSFEDLFSCIQWKEESINLFGKLISVPRLVAWYGHFNYRYSGIDHPANDFPGPVMELIRKLNNEFQFQADGVLCNLYRNGNDYMGWHRDNESSMDSSIIASVSFGASRTFCWKNTDHSQKGSIKLQDGSLLLMKNMQQHWKHALKQEKKIEEARINLTFRKKK